MTTAAVSPNQPSGRRRRAAGAVGIGEVVAWLGGVVCAYWMYWLIAVPLIEPGIEPESASYASADDVRAAYAAQSARKQALAAYFPPGSWELDNPAVWETDQTLLLFKTPKPLADGTVELRYCTLLYFPRARGEADLTKARPIVMRASEGATLRFDEPIVLKTVDLSKRRLVGGHLRGLITIQRDQSQPGAGDDLLITTRDIELAGDRAFSPHPVHFRLGRSRGSGRDLEILLADDQGRPGGGFRTGKVRTLLLKRDVIAHLALDDPAFARPGSDRLRQDMSGSTLKITCQGPFEYDFDRAAASFHERVDVVRLSTGPSDLLNCEVLTVYAEQGRKQPADPAAAAPSVASAAGSPDLPIRRIEARGDPVTLRSPSRGIYVQCRGLEFLPIPGDPFGRLVGIGPGVMQGVAPGTPPSKYQIQWTSEMRFEPAESGQYVASLHGGATVRVPNMGEVTANDRLDAQGRLVEQGRIFAWVTPLKETPPAAKQVVAARPVSMQVPASPPGVPADQGGQDTADEPGGKWQLERVLAQGNVIVDVPQLNATTGKLEVWIERPPAAADPAPPQAVPPPGGAPQPDSTPQSRQPASPTQRFAVRAGGVQVKLVPNGEQLAVASLTLDKEAHLQELSHGPDQRPMVVAGDRLHVAGANTPETRVTVAGKLAHIAAGGLELFGETIDLEKHTNRLWVDGAGHMHMALTQDLNGQPLSAPQSAEVSWQGSMQFRSNTAIFERNVRVESQLQRLSTPKLEAVLDRAIDFSNPNAAAAPGGRDRLGNPPNAPQLAFVRTHGEAFLESREVDPRGQNTSISQMKVFDLSINRTSGDMHGVGPGWVRRVARENGEGALARLAMPGQNRPPQKPAPPRPGLIYLHVQFQKRLRGNLNQRTLTFGEPTKTVYAPVADWDAQPSADDPAQLGPEGMVLDATELTVREMPARDRSSPAWFELVAQGNVLAEGAQFVALAHRATYSQDKDQLALEGDGRSPAEITYTAIAGGRRNEARADKITYAIGLRHVIFSGAHGLGVEVLQPQGNPQQKR
jgi:hypothetical protein